ncbi:hypothetical protein PFISCL1PPCAC_13704, partial [Pristionchus fissidentatus]
SSSFSFSSSSLSAGAAPSPLSTRLAYASRRSRGTGTASSALSSRPAAPGAGLLGEMVMILSAHEVPADDSMSSSDVESRRPRTRLCTGEEVDEESVEAGFTSRQARFARPVGLTTGAVPARTGAGRTPMGGARIRREPRGTSSQPPDEDESWLDDDLGSAGGSSAAAAAAA